VPTACARPPAALAEAARRALDALLHSEGWPRASAAGERFGSLFARDALITALAVLPVDPSVAHATLTRLGRELGTRHDASTEEEPGKVLHEARDEALDAYLAHGWPVRDGRLRYWGSIDSSAWFLVVAAALARAGQPVSAHLPAARRVAAWLARQPQPLAYDPRNTASGLAHQGWRDAAWDRQGHGHGVVGDDGRPLAPPVALAQVGALSWRALQDAHDVLGLATDGPAERARAAWFAAFAGLGEQGVPALACDGRGTHRAATSDLGQILWTGILDGTAAAAPTAARLHAPDLATPFGFRTLSSAHPAFSPSGYHTGAVWPFDSWLGGAGDGVLAALSCLGGFPELYTVNLDGSLAAHPEACTIQAWTVGAVIAIQAGWDGCSWRHDRPHHDEL